MVRYDFGRSLVPPCGRGMGGRDEQGGMGHVAAEPALSGRFDRDPRSVLRAISHLQRGGRAAGDGAHAGAKARSGSATAAILLWSDIPNNRILKWEEETGAVGIFRKPSDFANGNTRDRQGRLVTCEHGGRRVTRTEYDGSITVLMDRYQGKRLNSPNDVVVKSDGSIWFTDPPFGLLGNYEGRRNEQELPQNVYRIDGVTGEATACRDRHPRPERACLLARRDEALPRRIARDAEPPDPLLRRRRRAGRSPIGRSSSTRGLARPTASVATSTAIYGAAGAWARTSSTASSSTIRKASSSGASGCPSAAPMSASAGRCATVCSWRRASRCIRSTSTRKAHWAGEATNRDRRTARGDELPVPPIRETHERSLARGSLPERTRGRRFAIVRGHALLHWTKDGITLCVERDR